LKKRSVAKPPEQPVFFIDRSLGKIDVPGALRAAGDKCKIHDEHFDQQTEDEIWLKAVAAENWIVLTKDERIRYRPLELKAGICRAARIHRNLRGRPGDRHCGHSAEGDDENFGCRW
jgi:hypothetical protein